MNRLLWREYRLNRGILVSGAVLVLLPYAIADSVVGYALSSFFSQLIVALLAGNAMARERADRSAEFVATLPLGRWRRLAGKLILALITIALVWGLTLWGGKQVRLPEGAAAFIDLSSFAIGLLLIYAVGWLFTSFLSSAIFASVIGLMAPVLIMFLVFGVLLGVLHLDMTTKNWVALSGWVALVCLAVAIVCFSLGSRNFLSNCEP